MRVVRSSEVKQSPLIDTLGRVVRKQVNVNPGFNVNRSIIFSCLKMFFTSNASCSLK